MTKTQTQTPRDILWKQFPQYLERNVKNGGFSRLVINDSEEIIAAGMLPDYARLLLQSHAMIPIVLIDDTFECGACRGNIIIAMTISGNRTNIPLAWAWGPKDNNDAYSLVLSLLRQANPKLLTFISNEKAALFYSINLFFPRAINKFSPYHLIKGVSNLEAKNLLWQLFNMEHPDQFRTLKDGIQRKFTQVYNDVIANKEFLHFAPFFNHGPVVNGLKAPSPAESMNALLLPFRDKEPIEVFHFLEVYGYSQCLNLVLLPSEYTPYFQKRKAHIEAKMQNMRVFPFVPPYCFHVINENLGKQCVFRINLVEVYCTCGKFQDRCFPCAHFAAVCANQSQNWEEKCHPFYQTQTYRSALEDMHAPVELAGIDIDVSVRPYQTGSNTTNLTSRRRYKFELFKRLPNGQLNFKAFHPDLFKK